MGRGGGMPLQGRFGGGGFGGGGGGYGKGGGKGGKGGGKGGGYGYGRPPLPPNGPPVPPAGAAGGCEDITRAAEQDTNAYDDIPVRSRRALWLMTAGALTWGRRALTMELTRVRSKPRAKTAPHPWTPSPASRSTRRCSATSRRRNSRAPRPCVISEIYISESIAPSESPHTRAWRHDTRPFPNMAGAAPLGANRHGP